MSNHYKKLIFLLIPACAGFCLALALGSAEEPCELCHLCQNKALVKEAILAFDEDWYDANLPEQFDPNYVQYGPFTLMPRVPRPHKSGIWTEVGFIDEPVKFECIIAEGDIVVVRLYYEELWPGDLGWLTNYWLWRELAMYRIADGKIVEGWTARLELQPVIIPDE